MQHQGVNREIKVNKDVKAKFAGRLMNVAGLITVTSK